MSRRLVPSLTLGAALGATAVAPRALGAQEPAAHARIPIAARALPRGTVLTAADIAWVDSLAPHGRLRVLAAGLHVVPGWVTRRVLLAGEPLQLPAVAPPPLVRANQTVDLIVRRDDIQITLKGRALRDAAAGERVDVRVDGRRRFEGVVEGPGRVRLM